MKMEYPSGSQASDWKMYRYIPSLVGATVAMTIFIIMALLHFWQFLKLRNHIVIYVVIGAICEIGGFAARIGSHYDNEGWAAFITQGVLLLIGPLFFAATVYMMLGRIIRLFGGEDVSLIKPKWYTWIFVTADITTLIIQGLGASIMGTMKLDLAITGEKIIITGLALQVFSFVVFLVALIDFQIRMKRKVNNTITEDHSRSWRKVIWILYIVSALILFRCIFRLVEYVMGNSGYLIAHEWTLYAFDAVPMFLVLVLLLVLQPSKYVLQENRKMEEGSDVEIWIVQS